MVLLVGKGSSKKHISIEHDCSTHIKEVMEADSLCLGPVHLLIVVEEEPLCDAHIKQLLVPVVISHQVQSGLVTVPPSEVRLGLSLFPWRVAEGAQGRQDGEGDPVCVCVCVCVCGWVWVHVSVCGVCVCMCLHA